MARNCRRAPHFVTAVKEPLERHRKPVFVGILGGAKLACSGWNTKPQPDLNGVAIPVCSGEKGLQTTSGLSISIETTDDDVAVVDEIEHILAPDRKLANCESARLSARR